MYEKNGMIYLDIANDNMKDLKLYIEIKHSKGYVELQRCPSPQEYKGKMYCWKD